jgi:pimeloyl-ACP methyl ester carboxylesterase
MQTTLKVGDVNVALEYNLAPQMVLFSHGFGVRADSRGLFPAITQSLPRGWGYVQFDYDSFDVAKNQLTVSSMSDRLVRLQAVINWARQQSGVELVHMVAHSLGCLVAAELAPAGIGKMVLLSPPLALGSRFADIYTHRKGAKHTGHTWSLPRADGTTTIVDDEVFAELVSIDAEGELTKLAMFRPFSLILASADEVLPDADYTDLIVMPSVNGMGIDGADHNFGGQFRPELVRLVIEQLTGTYSTA